MPRIASDPAARLDKLAEARARITEDRVVNAKGLASVVGVTWRILERWIADDAEFPVIQRGGPGVAWEFGVFAVLDHLIAKATGKQLAREARMADTARLSGFGDGKASDGEAAPTQADVLADMGNTARALKSMGEAQMIAHRLKREQGEYVRADLVAALLGDMMTTIQTETLAIPARLDPSGQWPPHLRAGIEEELRGVLVTVHDKLGAWLAAQRALRAA